MSSTLLPFLYQTRTIQRVPASRAFSSFTRLYATRRDPNTPSADENIPFVGLEDAAPEEPTRRSNMTVAEKKVFRGIFEDISFGKLPTKGMNSRLRKRQAELEATNAIATSKEGQPPTSLNGETEGDAAAKDAENHRSVVEQARRLASFKEKVLPTIDWTMRDAAQAALKLYDSESDNSSSAMQALLESAKLARQEERKKKDLLRLEERKRVTKLMRQCETDTELWALLEKEVFCLPEKLGITAVSESESSLQRPGAKKQKTKKKKQKVVVDEVGIPIEATAPEGAKTATAQEASGEYSIDVHGSLYAEYLSQAVFHFENHFQRPSLLLFSVLPRIKALGLPSYILGASTGLYNGLAGIYWHHYGDAATALDLLDEMHSLGLESTEETAQLLWAMNQQLSACGNGMQGVLAEAVVEGGAYDEALRERLDAMEARETSRWNLSA